ncbi:MAG: amidohydrolase family protein, partial [Acidobacteriota bacterium]|nr:amidohydrolase family protein [Acidobacteriota bacterium]
MIPRLVPLVFLAAAVFAQNRFEPGTAPFLAFDSPVVALTHVRVIDGTGAAPREDQTLVIDHGTISAALTPPPGARVLDLHGQTVIPGLVGMHEHLFYPGGGGVPLYPEMGYTFPRLYLAAGVTTARTAGSVEPYTDLNIKAAIDAGRMPGPRLFVTGPYLEGKGAFTPQMHELSGPEEAARMVDFWADAGATSFKAYMNITRAELAAAVAAAHKRGIPVTGHLCSIGFREAAAIGIDNLEHGLLVDTEFHPGKQPDVCPPATRSEIARLDLNSAPVREMIADLVRRRVAITSTLAVFEAFDGERPPLDPRFLDAASKEAALNYLNARARVPAAASAAAAAALKQEEAFELAFVRAGGLLVAGADP